jgi:hypothetical protein
MRLFLFTDKNLYHHLLRGWSEEKLISGKIQTLTGRRIELHVNRTDTIYSVKQKIEDQEGIPIEKQELRKLKKKLEDDKTLEYYFIFEGDTLLLFVEGEWADLKGTLHSNCLLSISCFKVPQKEEEEPTVLSTKIRAPTEQTQVITIAPEEGAEKQDNKQWWESSSVFTSGPQKPKKITTTTSVENTASIVSTPITPPTEPPQRSESDASEREKRLKAIEARLNKNLK